MSDPRERSNVVIARLYSENDLVGIFPRTSTHGELLEDLIFLSNGEERIERDSQEIYLGEQQEGINNPLKEIFEKSDDALRLVTATHPLPEVLLRLEQGDFAEEVIQAAQNLLEKGNVRTAEKIYDLKTRKGVWTPQPHGFDCMRALFKRKDKYIEGGYFDRVPLLTFGWTVGQFENSGVRFMPLSFSRAGAYIGPGTALMPTTIVNVGAYIEGEGVMIDGGARVATGAQIGRKVKMGAGSGVEGVLEPRGMMPTIVEDGVRIGAQCELAGIIEEGAAIASGVVMTKQKRIFDMRTNDFQEPRVISINGERKPFPYIPANRIAIPGVYMKERGKYQIGIACTLLLEKDASEIDFMSLPKDNSLYITV